MIPSPYSSRARVSSASSTASAPSRIVPPRSSTSFCSGSRSITGNGVSGSISVELAPSSPQTCRANSETATCIPRQMPRYGIASSRATRQARIFPSHPREPKPPGTSTPSTSASSARASSSDMFSASTQRTLTRQPEWMPACLSASCTDRYASCSFTYFPTSAISTVPLRSPSRSTRRAPPPEPLDERVPLAHVGLRRVEAELLADELVEPLVAERVRHEVHVGHVQRGDDRGGVDVGEQRDLVADVLAQRIGRAADEHVGMDADAAQLVDRVLRRLRLQLAGGGDERHPGDVEVQHVAGAHLAAELADRLEERLRLEVADGAADLGDDDVGAGRLR